MNRFASVYLPSVPEQAPSGLYIARCIAAWDLGTHVIFDRAEAFERTMLLLRFELVNTQNSDGLPYTISTIVTNCLNDPRERSCLRIILTSLLGHELTPQEERQFDLNTLAGKALGLRVFRNYCCHACIGYVKPPPAGVDIPESINPISVFWIDEWDPATWGTIPFSVKNIIIRSKEYRARALGLTETPSTEEMVIEPPFFRSNDFDDFVGEFETEILGGDGHPIPHSHIPFIRP